MISLLILELEILRLHKGRTVSRLVELLLLLFRHVFEAFDQPVAFGLAAEAGEGEANVPLGGDVVEAQGGSLGDLHCRHHAGVVLLDPHIVVGALVVEILASGAHCFPVLLLAFSN